MGEANSTEFRQVPAAGLCQSWYCGYFLTAFDKGTLYNSRRSGVKSWRTRHLLRKAPPPDMEPIGRD